MVRVLVVEDDDAVMDITCRYVESVDGFAVAGTARDGEEAKAMVLGLRPDLLVLDIFMPKKTGIELLRELRAEGCRIEAVFLTASNDDDVRRSVEALGIADYLVKPFNYGRFREALGKVAVRLAAGVPAAGSGRGE